MIFKSHTWAERLQYYTQNSFLVAFRVKFFYAESYKNIFKVSFKVVQVLLKRFRCDTCVYYHLSFI